jgi:membrane protein implicated in regulation of membrane protease activity
MSIWESLQHSFASEPALWTGGAAAIVGLLVSFGVQITSPQQTAIAAIVSALVTIGATVVIRSQVTPTSKLPSPSSPASGKS